MESIPSAIHTKSRGVRFLGISFSLYVCFLRRLRFFTPSNIVLSAYSWPYSIAYLFTDSHIISRPSSVSFYCITTVIQQKRVADAIIQNLLLAKRKSNQLLLLIAFVHIYHKNIPCLYQDRLFLFNNSRYICHVHSSNIRYLI